MAVLKSNKIRRFQRIVKVVLERQDRTPPQRGEKGLTTGELKQRH